MNKFVELFKKYNWNIEILGVGNFIAYNENYFVPFSVIHQRIPEGKNYTKLVGVSYLIEDKKEFIKIWKTYNQCNKKISIGYFAYNDYMCTEGKFRHYGFIAGNNHNLLSIERWLKDLQK